MVIEKKIQKIGNKLGIILTKKDLESLKLGVGGRLKVGGMVSESKPKTGKRLTAVQKARVVTGILDRYDGAFRELAK